MFRLTCIDLDNGEFAVYINNHYLGSEIFKLLKLIVIIILIILSVSI